jgi:hypothetical protein
MEHQNYLTNGFHQPISFQEGATPQALRGDNTPSCQVLVLLQEVPMDTPYSLPETTRR